MFKSKKEKARKALSKKGYSNPEEALFAAAKSGDPAAIDQAIQAGADVRAKDGCALYWAARQGHSAAINTLVDHGADVHAKYSLGLTALHWAAVEGNTDAIDALVRHGADIHTKNNNGDTALHYAANNGNTAAIDALIRHGADVHAKNNTGDTALHYAAHERDSATIDALVRHGADVHAKNNYGDTTLHSAAFFGETAVIDALVRYGADLQAKNNDGYTALHYAARRGYITAIVDLIHHGADVYARDNDGKTPAMHAREEGKTLEAEQLEAYEKGYQPGPSSVTIIDTPTVARMWREEAVSAKLAAYEKQHSTAPRPSTLPMPSSSITSEPYEEQKADEALKALRDKWDKLVAKPSDRASLSGSPSSTLTSAMDTHLNTDSGTGSSITAGPPVSTTKPVPAEPKVLPKAPIGQASARYPYTASDATELTLVQGQLVSVIEKQASGWWLCELHGKRGLVPGNYLQEGVVPSASLPATFAQVPSTAVPVVAPVVITPVVTPPHAISTPSRPSAPASSTPSGGEAGVLSLTDTKDFDQWVISYSDLTLGKRLGKGSFGEVHLATYVHEPVAVKTLFVGETPKALEDFKREITVMMHLKSMYIVQLRAVTIKPYSMVMEYLPKGSLTQLLRNPNEPMPWSQRHQLASDIAKGLAFLHRHHVFHRDLKSDNVLLTDTYQAKLSDFGLSKIKVASSQYMSAEGSVGTLCWMAPEVMDDEHKSPYRAASDVYSYAMVVWELMTRREPYEGLSSKQLFVKVVIKAQRELIPEDAPPILQTITAQGWAQTPEERPTADDIVKQLAANPIAASAEPPGPIGLASNTSSIDGQRLGFGLRSVGGGLAPNTQSIGAGKAVGTASATGLVPNTASVPPRTSGSSDSRRMSSSHGMSDAGLVPNTASIPLGTSGSSDSRRMSSSRGMSDEGVAPHTTSLDTGTRPSVLSRAGFWNNLASLPPASRASVPPTMPRR